MQLLKGASASPVAMSMQLPQTLTLRTRARPSLRTQLPCTSSPHRQSSHHVCTASRTSVIGATVTALVLNYAPLSLAADTLLDNRTVADDMAVTMDVPKTLDEQRRVKAMVQHSLTTMLEAADHLSRSTGSLLSLNTPEAKAGELLSTSQQVVDVALRMSEDAMTLANEADELASLESVPEAERKLAYQIYEAAKLVSSIAHDLATSEQDSLTEMQVSP